jgi:AcrR family transcriptional regulator
VFAQYGSAGATTRRIAEEAGVNEVTLFRLFGSKDALLDEAVRMHASREQPSALPAVPADPERELADWCASELARLGRSAELLRQCFAESEEHAAHVRDAGVVIARSTEVLRAYVERLGARATLGDRRDRDTAVTMLVSTIVTDALARAEMPGVHTSPRAEAPAHYARSFLRVVGYAPDALTPP